MTTYTAKELQRMEIQLHTADFLSRGGRVKEIEYGESVYSDQPVKLTRREQVERARKFRVKG